MNNNNLPANFKGVAARKLTPNDCNLKVSNQHELDASKDLRGLLGEVERKHSERKGIKARAFYFDDESESPLAVDVQCSWYDCRKNQKHRSSEWRLYYSDSSVLGFKGKAQAGDLLIVALGADEEKLSLIVAKEGSSIEQQLIWLFGLTSSGKNNTTEVTVFDDVKDLNFLARDLLTQLEVDVSVPDQENMLDQILEKFGDSFPRTDDFSLYARSSLDCVEPASNPDHAIIQYLEKEERLFRILEKHLVQQKIQSGFEEVDEFISFSLSVQNRRKSRAGLAFENHLNHIFSANGLVYKWKAQVENRKKPDFLFPGEKEYFDENYPVEALFILGAKTSCKDRWRQVLSEGSRVTKKHLVTIQPTISVNQLKEMSMSELQLVVPEEILTAYPKKHGVLRLVDFIELVKEKQIP